MFDFYRLLSTDNRSWKGLRFFCIILKFRMFLSIFYTFVFVLFSYQGLWDVYWFFFPKNDISHFQGLISNGSVFIIRTDLGYKEWRFIYIDLNHRNLITRPTCIWFQGVYCIFWLRAKLTYFVLYVHRKKLLCWINIYNFLVAGEIETLIQ